MSEMLRQILRLQAELVVLTAEYLQSRGWSRNGEGWFYVSDFGGRGVVSMAKALEIEKASDRKGEAGNVGKD